MNIFLTILFIILLIITLTGIIYIHLYNKIDESIIRIKEADERINTNIGNKFSLLDRAIPLIKKEVKLEEDAFKDIIKFRARRITNFELDKELIKYYQEFIDIIDKNKKLQDNLEVMKINKQIILIDDELLTLREYYNANVKNYNNMIKKFPTNIIANIKHYTSKELYLEDKTDNLEEL